MRQYFRITLFLSNLFLHFPRTSFRSILIFHKIRDFSLCISCMLILRAIK
jgi:hypothetical protein